MRMMLRVSMPVEAANLAIKEGTLPKIVEAWIGQFKPEACFFTAMDGKRTALLFFDLPDPSMIPSVAEPFFQGLSASIELHPCMNVEEMKAGVARAVRR